MAYFVGFRRSINHYIASGDQAGGLSRDDIACDNPDILTCTHDHRVCAKLASQGLLNLLTGGLDNRNGGTVAANKLLTLTASGTVQNSANGLIFSRDAGLTLNAASLDNAKGSLQSQGDLTVKTSGAIDNQSGRIVAKDGNLDITAASLDSRGGVLSSLQGAFSSHITGVLRNGYDLNNNRQGGIIQAQSLDLKALAGIDNYGGRITAQTGDAIVDAGTNGNFDNRNGGLYAKGLVSVTAKDFDNSGDNDGQIAGQQVDLSLRGALNTFRCPPDRSCCGR